MLFSQRMGITPIKKVLQINSMDDDLRTALWNRFYANFLVNTQNSSVYGTPYTTVYVTIWVDLFKKRVNELPDSGSKFAMIMQTWFFNSEWYEVYDLLQMVSADSLDSRRRTLGVDFRKICNIALKDELSGYRFVGESIVEITNEHEIAEIEEAIEQSQNTKLYGVHLQLKSAVAMLSDKKEPNYRKSITESIGAVEAIVKIITGIPNASLGQALKVIDRKIELHSALIESYNKLYGYTSNEDGLRHGMVTIPNIDFEDAKYMLVSCSAFTNYLITKSIKAGIDFS